MIEMKKIAFILIILSSLSFTTSVIVNNTKILISPNSQLFIKGFTNVNSFICAFNIKELNKPIPLYYKIIEDKIVFEKAKLVLDNNCFDCGHRGMNKDFMTLLKSEDYPEILLELKEIHKNKHTPSVVDALVELEIAGKTKSYPFSIEIKEEGNIRVSGSLKINITDFGLNAPKKALGLIVVSEDIEIKFELLFSECKN